MHRAEHKRYSSISVSHKHVINSFVPRTGFEEVVQLRGNQLVSNKLNADGSHEIIARLENKGRPNELYRRVDCSLFVYTGSICINCNKLLNTLGQIRGRHVTGVQAVKISHASEAMLVQTVHDQRKVLHNKLFYLYQAKFCCML